MTPAAILRAAAARVTDETWCQGGGDCYSDCPTCAEGHIWRECNFKEPAPKVTSVLAEYVSDGGTDGGYVIDWNDAPGRTATEVRAAMLAAADAWEREQGGAA